MASGNGARGSRGIAEYTRTQTTGAMTGVKENMMGQVNVNTDGTTAREGSSTGTGMMIGLLVGLILLLLVAWWAFTQSGWFGTGPAPANTNVSVTTNNPAGGTGSTGSTGGTTGGRTTGGTTGSTTGGTTGR